MYVVVIGIGSCKLTVVTKYNIMKKGFSQRGSNLIVLNNYKYRFDQNLKTTYEERWRCVVRTCAGALYTFEDGSVLSRLGHEHNHEPHAETSLNRQRKIRTVKRKVVEKKNIDEMPAKIIRCEIAEQKTTVPTLTRQDKMLIKNSIICKKRLKALTKLPKSSAKVNLYS